MIDRDAIDDGLPETGRVEAFTDGVVAIVIMRRARRGFFCCLPTGPVDRLFARGGQRG